MHIDIGSTSGTKMGLGRRLQDILLLQMKETIRVKMHHMIDRTETLMVGARLR